MTSAFEPLTLTDDEAEFVARLTAQGRDVTSVLRHSRHVLDTARQGAQQAAPYTLSLSPGSVPASATNGSPSVDPQLRESLHTVSRAQQSGMQIAIAFGVATTLTIQNLRNKVSNFDRWWEGWRSRLREDELARYFWVMRSVILKEGYLGAIRIRFDASVDAYDAAVGTLETRLSEPPRVRNGSPLDDLPSHELLALWLDTLEEAIDEADARWGDPAADRYGSFLELIEDRPLSDSQDVTGG